MLTPNEQPANKLEKVMLLSLWANTIKEEKESLSQNKKFIFAGLGKPTYPINHHTIRSYLSYWQRLDRLSTRWHQHQEEMEENSAIDYGDPRGDLKPRAIMAKAMSKWYGTDIDAKHILFTVGGIGALRVIFETFNTHFDDVPGYRIITPFPHYSAYANNPKHQLYPIDVMQEPGYKLTAAALQKSLQEAYDLARTDGGFPKAILICNPSNPLGNIIDTHELYKIAEVCRQYPELYLIFDEAYAEMSFIEMTSFLQAAPDLKNRTIILRSATKALSAAGERMAILLTFDDQLMNELLNKNISYFVHAPRSAQIAYSETMAHFDVDAHQALINFYRRKVEYVVDRLTKMGASMPDPNYKVEATFYVLADLSEIFGMDLPVEAARVLQRSGKVGTGEELAYYLLFKESLMIAPLSYFGFPEDSGVMRITCSGSDHELKEMMDRLEHVLMQARQRLKNRVN